MEADLEEAGLENAGLQEAGFAGNQTFSAIGPQLQTARFGGRVRRKSNGNPKRFSAMGPQLQTARFGSRAVGQATRYGGRAFA